MSALPDRRRLGLVPAARSVASSVARAAAVAAWRTLNPSQREPYTEAEAPTPLTRMEYRAPDGWRCSLRFFPPCPGGGGEPVVLAHALGMDADVFRYGAGPSLVSRLSEAGFSVYLFGHRGDADAVPPGANRGFCFDDLVELDLAAAVGVVAQHAEFPRVHLIGHGLGGQMALALATRRAAEVASVVALSTPVCFPDAPAASKSMGWMADNLPPHWRIPVRALGPVVAPWIDAEHPGWLRATPPSRVRGLLHHGVEDLPVALLAQASRWLSSGVFCDRAGALDYLEASVDAQAPLLLGVGRGDPWAPPHRVLPLGDRWGGEWEILEFPDHYGHLDPVTASDADQHVFGPVIEWLVERRRLAW
jgi:pimeloyl-ACP methyl ester carboxylesterase